MHQPSLMIQSLSMLGALLCLLAYMGLQFHKLNPKKIPYNALNMWGSAILGYVAIYPFQAGFFIMETVWFTTSLIGCYHAIQLRKNGRNHTSQN